MYSIIYPKIDCVYNFTAKFHSSFRNQNISCIFKKQLKSRTELLTIKKILKKRKHSKN